MTTAASSMKRYLALAVSAALLLAGFLVVVKAASPALYYSLMLQLNIVTVSADTLAEQRRLTKIQLLPISDEKKSILVRRTIFHGASPAMVELALGRPLMTEFSKEPGKERALIWVYHFQNDHRPTVIEFADNRLASAYRTSTHKLEIDTAQDMESVQDVNVSR